MPGAARAPGRGGQTDNRPLEGTSQPPQHRSLLAYTKVHHDAIGPQSARERGLRDPLRSTAGQAGGCKLSAASHAAETQHGQPFALTRASYTDAGRSSTLGADRAQYSRGTRLAPR